MRTSKQTKIQSWLLVALFGLFVASCGNEENLPGMDGNGSDVITFTVTPDYGVNTRTALDIPAGKVLRFIMEVYDSSDNLVADSRQVKTLTADGEVKFSLSKTITDSKVVFWADYADDADTDWFYDTTNNGLKAISIKPVNMPSGTTFYGEAFYGSTIINTSGTPASTSVTLVHAVAQVNLKSTVQMVGMGSVAVTYGEAGNTNAPMTVFNALDGTVTTATTLNGITNPVDAAVTSFPYGFHTYYVFASKTSQTIINVKIELCSDAAGATTVVTTEIPNVPLRANYRTNITGDFLNNIFSISCNSAWGGEWEVPVNIWDGTPATANASYVFGGEATKSGDNEADAYVLSSAADLAQLAANVNSGISYENKYFKLTTNIDLDGHAWTPIGISTGDYTTEKPFKGNFDGGQHQIQGLKINSDLYYVGFFGIAPNGTIKNLHVSGDIVATNATNSNFGNGAIAAAGGIAGDASNSDIRNCSFRGSIDAQMVAGGIVGHIHWGEVTACKNSGNIKGVKAAGGITGQQFSIPVWGCYNEGTIEGSENIGGITGYMSDAGVEVKGCYNIGELKAIGSSIPTSIVGIGPYDVFLCYVKEKYTNSTDAETVFAYRVWPTSTIETVWYANESNDGAKNCYWKSLGTYNWSNTVYPKLWWED